MITNGLRNGPLLGPMVLLTLVLYLAACAAPTQPPNRQTRCLIITREIKLHILAISTIMSFSPDIPADVASWGQGEPYQCTPTPQAA